MAAGFDEREDDGEARDAALRATRVATLLAPDQNISMILLVGHAQATAADLLRTLGLDQEPAHQLVGEAAIQAQRDAAASRRSDARQGPVA